MIESVEAAMVGLAELDPVRQEPDSGPVSSRRRLEDWWDVDDRLLLERILATPRSGGGQITQADFKMKRHGPARPRTWAVIGVAALIAVVAAIAGLVDSSPNSRLHQSVTPPTKPRPAPATKTSQWQLAAYLSGVRFQAATGNPGAVVGAVCNGLPTCFLSTGYGLDYGGGGGMYVSHDSGKSWQPTTLPPNVAITTLASCVTSTWCAAGAGTLDASTGDPAAKKPSRDPELMVTTDAGSTWTTHPVPIPVNVQQLPAYNNLPAETTYWPGQVDAVSCSSPGVCNVVGHVERNSDVSGPASDALVFLHTDDGGSTWSSTVLPETADELSLQVVMQSGSSVSMACPTKHDCVVLGTLLNIAASGVVDAWQTVDGGKSWTEHRIPGLSNLTSDLSCPTVSDCWAGPMGVTPTSGPSLLHSSDGGTTWTLVPLGPGIGGEWISCTSGSVCYLANGGIDETTDGGATWRRMNLPTGVGNVLQVSCIAEGSCVAIANPTIAIPGSINQYNGGSLILSTSPSGQT
jgi:hypothetical protein